MSSPSPSPTHYMFLEYAIIIYSIWMLGWIHCMHPSTRGRHVCVVVFILVAWIQSGTVAVKWTKCVLMGVSSWQSHTPSDVPSTIFSTQNTSSRLGLLNIHYALCVWTGPNKPQHRLSARLCPTARFALNSYQLSVLNSLWKPCSQ